jgi:predicted DsbA family dithiol-disulfide isomerase
MRIDIFSDTICPWCYLGKRRLQLAVAARPQYSVIMTWRPFELNPDIPVDGLDRAAHLAARAGDAARAAEAEADLTRMGLASGIQFRFDLITRLPNSRRSHLLIAHAARLGLQGEVKERILRAYFEEGRDIADVETLVQLGEEVGLRAADSRRVLILRAGQDGVVAAERHAQVMGINSVPTFIFEGQYSLSGAQEVGVFAQVLDQVSEMADAGKPA